MRLARSAVRRRAASLVADLMEAWHRGMRVYLNECTIVGHIGGNSPEVLAHCQAVRISRRSAVAGSGNQPKLRSLKALSLLGILYHDEPKELPSAVTDACGLIA